jgi:DNA-binding SARP family transcriptional activator
MSSPIPTPTGADSETAAPAEATPAMPDADVFWRFPHGVLVLSRTGDVLAANPAARELLGHADQLRELLDLPEAGAPGRPPIAELASRVREGDELTLDAFSARSGRRLTITALALDGTPPRIVVQVRLRKREATRAPAAAAASPAPLRVISFGRTMLQRGKEQARDRWLEQRPGQLLKYLLCRRGEVVPTEAIAEALWPDGGPAAAGNVRHYVHRLRDELEPERERRSASTYVSAHRGGYRLEVERLRIDSVEFEQELKAGLAAHTNGDREGASERLGRALDLYRGDFLADEPYATWVMDERDRLRDLAYRGLRTLAATATEAGDLDAALAHTRRLAELEPYDTDIERELLTLLLRQGRRTEASRRFQVLRRRMLREFGEEPGFDLGELREASLAPLQRA